MPYLQDDGTTVTLDLHGCSIDAAVQLTHAALRESARRGRGSVKLIHGASTSSSLHRNRTIKHALEDLLARGALPGVTGHWPGEGYLLLSLRIGAPRNPTLIRLRDVYP